MLTPDPELEAAVSHPIAPAERAAAIGARLRQIFDEAAAEPMPNALEALLRKLG